MTVQRNERKTKNEMSYSNLDAGLSESRQVRPIAKLARIAPNADPL